MSLDELARIANMMPELIYIIKFFGTVIASLLSVIAIMVGVIWTNLRKEIKANKDEAERALKEHKEDGKDQCAICYQTNIREHNSLREAIDACSRGVDRRVHVHD